jgi:transposase-like protein
MTSRRSRHLNAEEKAALELALITHPTIIEAAKAVGVNRSTASSHLNRLRNEGRLGGVGGVNKAGLPPAPEPPTPAHLRRITQLEDEISQLRRKLKDSHRDALADEAILSVLGVIARAPSEPPEWLVRMPARTGEATPEVPVAIWSDWHLGEVVEPAEVNGVNAYNLEIAERRIRRLFDGTIDICTNHGPGKYPGIVINLLGDFVSGALHPELAKSDEEGVIPTVLRCRDLLIAGLTRMADVYGRVYAPCAAGNHGRITAKPEFKGYYQKNWDWLLVQLVSRHFEGDDRVHIDIRPSNEVLYQVYGMRFLAMHGDMLGVKGGDGIIGSLGPIARGETKVRGQGASFGRDYDMLLIGHWHQSLWLPKVTVANTLKGFDEYAKNALRAPVSEPSQPLFFVHPRRGITSRWEVKVEEPKPAAKQWVSWPEAA